MCVICTLWEQEKLTTQEANNAVFEQVATEDLTEEERSHVIDELLPRILKAIGYDLKRLYPAPIISTNKDA